MKPEQQRIAIAEACGWKWDGRFTVIDPKGNRLCNNDGDTGLTWKQACAQNKIPDYLNDLNAMHEAEKLLVGNTVHHGINQAIFCNQMFKVLNSSEGVSEFMKIHAPASVRAEAFLKTLKLYTP